MEIKKYYRPLHEGHLRAWLRLRDLSADYLDTLPEIGCVAFEKDIGIGAGFLRQMEGGMAMFDNLITNPQAPSDLRNRALDWILEEMVKVAKFYRMTSIIGLTKDARTLERSIRHGFRVVPHAVLLNL